MCGKSYKPPDSGSDLSAKLSWRGSRKKPQNKRFRRLLLAALIWGAAFVPQRTAMKHLEPLTFNGIRFALGALALIPVIALQSRRPNRTNGRVGSGDNDQRLPIGGGAAIGLVLFVAASLQQAGLVHTTAGKGGFITGFYVPLVPIFGLFLGQRTRVATWAGAVLAVVGLYFLSVVGPFQINRGDGLVMVGTLFWAIQVLMVGRFAPRTDPVKLGFVQFSVVAVASLIAAGLVEQITIRAIAAAKWEILYGGLGSVSIAYTLQLVGQRHAPPGHAAVVLNLEAVFAAIAGYCVLDERFGTRELFGAAVMLVGMMVSQAGLLFRRRASVSERCNADAVFEPCREP